MTALDVVGPAASSGIPEAQQAVNLAAKASEKCVGRVGLNLHMLEWKSKAALVCGGSLQEDDFRA